MCRHRAWHPEPADVHCCPAMRLIYVALLLCFQEARRAHRTLFGKVLAPGPGPGTSLVITDIQDSTTLYECLPGGARVVLQSPYLSLTCIELRSTWLVLPT